MTQSESTPKIRRRVFVAGAASAAIAGGTGLAFSAQNQSKKIRVAQIGLQGHPGIVMQGLNMTKNCELVAFAPALRGESIDHIKRNCKVAEKTRVYDDYRKMLDEVKPDIASVFMPYGFNGQANIEAARRGCHIISEKPLATSMEDLDTLRKERDRNNIRITALFPTRFNPMFAAAHAAVKAGTIGEPVLVSAQKSYRFGTGRPDYFKKRKTYGGSIPWIAIHAIDFIRYVSGLEYANVTARHAVKVNTDYPECEDCGAILFEMKNGGQCTLTFDYLRPTKAASHGDDRLRVVGSKGIIEIRNGNDQICELMTHDKAPHQLPWPKIKKNIFVDFVESLVEGKTHYLTAEDPFRNTEVAIKARDAADTRKTVPL